MNIYDKNQPEFYYGIGKEGIVKEGIFERFPDLRPAVGEYYWREDGQHKKMLLVGESNYFDDNDIPDSDFRDVEKWYKAEEAKLIPEAKKVLVNNWKGDYPTFDRVYKVMDEVLAAANVEHNDYLLQETAFYNYFLRPAYNDGKHKGFIPQDIDREVSGVALSGIIDRLNPDLVIFLSKNANDEFLKYIRCNSLQYGESLIQFVYHPGNHFSWYNANGKAKFERLLKEYWISK